VETEFAQIENDNYDYPQQCRHTKRPCLGIANLEKEPPQLPLPPSFRGIFNISFGSYFDAALKLAK